MKLTDAQKQQYREQGYLFFPNLLSEQEVGVLRGALPTLMEHDGPQVRRDKPDLPPKLIYAPDTLSPAYRALTRLPRVLEPVQALLDEQVYIYQSRINLKYPFTGDAWSWHQDFTAWHRGDGMPRPHAIMTAVFLHDCTVANGPLLVIPKSHSEDVEEILAREADVQGYEVQRVTTDVIRDLAEKTSIVDLCGPAGSVAFIHPTLLHGSAPNLTPWPRSIVYINFSAVTNVTFSNKRPWYMNNTDTAALESGEDGALLNSVALAS